MNTPKTDAVRGMGRVSIHDFYAMYDHAKKLELQVQELREALEGLLSIESTVTQGQEREFREKFIPIARAILEKTK